MSYVCPFASCSDTVVDKPPEKPASPDITFSPSSSYTAYFNELADKPSPNTREPIPSPGILIVKDTLPPSGAAGAKLSSEQDARSIIDANGKDNSFLFIKVR